MPTEILRFQTNVPEVIALAFDEGKAVQGRFGDQMFYTLADGRSTYVPLIVDAKRKELGIRKDEEFVVCKREVTEGTRRAVRWEVERAEEPEAAPTYQANAAPVPQRSVELPHVTAAPPAVQPAGDARPRTKLEDALKTVVAAIHATRMYAKEIGYEMPVFGPEDIRTMANTLIIESRNGGAR